MSKLNFSVPNEVIRQIVQCRPGVVEQVLLLLRQKIEEKQKLVKAVPGPGQVSRAGSYGEQGWHDSVLQIAAKRCYGNYHVPVHSAAVNWPGQAWRRCH